MPRMVPTSAWYSGYKTLSMVSIWLLGLLGDSMEADGDLDGGTLAQCSTDIDGVVRWLADESSGRVWNHDDQLHLCGAYRNNRTVPSEGILVSEIPGTQQALVTKIVDAFLEYLPISSPVLIVEFDHHSGVFLTNMEPAKFHIHTLLRTPNAGDYSVATDTENCPSTIVVVVASSEQ
ncbi:hypothetical protein F503_06138 [Ophiostoma piceae UAMH 11346]|uniref:Uncharacterized protein n=1 Tax=Ophiostoma piceae (strain UAMH 11346) TaxID=1262450 RepID=S3BLM2_OPHP1|nr:hypothetical protein F503_06138 [Ophiostoma piceae UAMH 11346]